MKLASVPVFSLIFFSMSSSFGIASTNVSFFQNHWGDQPADRHNRGCNLSFADGHVEYWKWAWSRTVTGWGQDVAGELDLRDLRRVQEGVRQTFE